MEIHQHIKTDPLLYMEDDCKQEWAVAVLQAVQAGREFAFLDYVNLKPSMVRKVAEDMAKLKEWSDESSAAAV